MPPQKWEFLPQQKKMGMTTDLFFKTLPASGFSKEEILVREALQNCRDARSEEAKESGQPVQVTLTKRQLTGDGVKQLVSGLVLKDALDRADHIFNPVWSAGFKKLLQGRTPLTVLEVADNNTTGLGGRWDGQEVADHFSRLVINLGASEKIEGGGSFGFGKTVFAKQSGLNLVVYYSVFEPSNETDQTSARLMAVWLMRPHKIGVDRYTGFAFLGKASSTDADSVEPFVDDEAHSLAIKLGLARRTPSEKGTTVLVLDCDLDMESIGEAIERYWWPSIHDHVLAARVYDGDKQIAVRPKKNPRVAPFLTAYIDLQTDRPSGNDTKVSSSGTQAREFRRIEGKRLGWLAIRTLSDLEIKLWKDCEGARGEDSDDGEVEFPVGGIARIRDSGMVVSYEADQISQSTPCIGLFQAAKDVDQILRISEPQTHDRWDSEERRLDESEHFGDDFTPGLGKRVVRSINKRIRSQLRDFQRDVPDPAPPPEYKLKALEALLAKLMNAGNENPAVPPGPPRPFSISVQPKRRQVGNGYEDHADIELALNEDFPEDSLNVEIVVTRELLGDTTGRVVDRLPCFLSDPETGRTAEGAPAVVPLTLSKAQVSRLTAVGNANESFKTRYRVEARKPQT